MRSFKGSLLCGACSVATLAFAACIVGLHERSSTLQDHLRQAGVIIEYVNSTPVVTTASFRLDPVLQKYSELVDFDHRFQCASPSAPGRTGNVSLITGTLREGAHFQQLRELVSDGSRVVGLFGDPPIIVANQESDGSGDEWGVADQLDVKRVWQEYGKGDGVFLAVVDGGINVNWLKATGRFDANHNWSYSSDVPGKAKGSTHGSMVAFDSAIAAPHATLGDYVIGTDTTTAIAACAFTHLEELVTEPQWLTEYTGTVVLNSWAVRPDLDVPPVTETPLTPCGPSDPRMYEQNYGHNPCHPLNRAAASLADNVTVVFAAGDDSTGLKNGACDPLYPGNIFGANSLPTVLTVAAVNLATNHLTLSSIGPGAFATSKPDVSTFAGFRGFSSQKNDNGASAAAGVAAGVVAALLSGLKTFTVTELHSKILSAAKPLGSTKGDCRFGQGLLYVP